MLWPKTINRANILGMALSVFGLGAVLNVLPFQRDLGTFSEPFFLEDALNPGQGKGYPWLLAKPARKDAFLTQLIESAPRARAHFSRPEDVSELFQFIVEKSREYGVSPLLVVSLIDVESGFRPEAISKRGAVGLMQLLPATAEEVANDAGLIWYPDMLKDPKANIELGLRYMKKLQYQFDSPEQVLTAYNIGPAALRSKLDLGEAMPQEYVRRVKVAVTSRASRFPRVRGSKLWARAWL
jgi:soluble lytic murein transglycosylase-like protein